MVKSRQQMVAKQTFPDYILASLFIVRAVDLE